jgi:hypothetical protein
MKIEVKYVEGEWLEKLSKHPLKKKTLICIPF